jgi:hypothetical protein
MITVAIILFNINRLIFVMEAVCVYCEVLAEHLCIVWIFGPKVLITTLVDVIYLFYWDVVFISDTPATKGNIYRLAELLF